MFIVPFVLASASMLAAPDDPPVYGPCAPLNPDTQYTDPTIGSTGLDPTCVALFRMRMATNKAAYWVRVWEECGGGDCQCYADAWARFLQAMQDAQVDLLHCLPAGN